PRHAARAERAGPRHRPGADRHGLPDHGAHTGAPQALVRGRSAEGAPVPGRQLGGAEGADARLHAARRRGLRGGAQRHLTAAGPPRAAGGPRGADRKSTRLNSSHVKISYAVFCLKKKKKTKKEETTAPKS